MPTHSISVTHEDWLWAVGVDPKERASGAPYLKELLARAVAADKV